MDIKILNSMTKYSLENISNTRHCFVIGTHNGIFHSDEVVAIAILCLLYDAKKIRIVRTRDMEILKECDICVDIGGGDFDHHQPGFDLKRDNGIKYASAGLVWKDFGKKLLYKYMAEFFPETLCCTNNIFEKFDDDVISLVDCEDNGIEADKHCFSFISSFLPIWNDDNPNYDKQFLKVLDVTIKIFEQELFKTIGSYIAEQTIKIRSERNSKYFSNNILEIPSQTIPWIESVVAINESSDSGFIDNDLILFVIFPYPAGGWAAQCVPPSLEKKFEKRIPFPKEWAGQTDNLPEISGIKDATFCHNGCFFARAKTKESIMKMCEIALNKFMSK